MIAEKESAVEAFIRSGVDLFFALTAVGKFICLALLFIFTVIIALPAGIVMRRISDRKSVGAIRPRMAKRLSA